MMQCKQCGVPNAAGVLSDGTKPVIHQMFLCAVAIYALVKAEKKHR